MRGTLPLMTLLLIGGAAVAAPTAPERVAVAPPLPGPCKAQRTEVDAAMREVPAQVRASLTAVRASIAAAAGLSEAERRAALDGIDEALAGLLEQREPTSQ